jgi:hypothetical protein
MWDTLLSWFDLSTSKRVKVFEAVLNAYLNRRQAGGTSSQGIKAEIVPWTLAKQNIRLFQ